MSRHFLVPAIFLEDAKPFPHWRPKYQLELGYACKTRSVPGMDFYAVTMASEDPVADKLAAMPDVVEIPDSAAPLSAKGKGDVAAVIKGAVALASDATGKDLIQSLDRALAAKQREVGAIRAAQAAPDRKP